MFIYNVTLSIDKVIEPEWVHWMKAEHIPHVMNTGLFTDYKFFKVLSHDDPSTSSFCVMYTTPALDNFVKYLNEHAPALRAEVDQKYAGKYAAFRTLLEEVQ
jgi:hypothetical protein